MSVESAMDSQRLSLPFRLRVPGRDAVDRDGAWQISYRIDGFLHLVDATLTIEWSGTRHTQQVSFAGVVDDVEPSARHGSLVLRINRRDRDLAATMVKSINARCST